MAAADAADAADAAGAAQAQGQSPGRARAKAQARRREPPRRLPKVLRAPPTRGQQEQESRRTRDDAKGGKEGGGRPARVHIDGEAIIARLSEALKSGRRPSESEFQMEPILESVFAHVIREFLMRNDHASRGYERSRHTPPPPQHPPPHQPLSPGHGDDGRRDGRPVELRQGRPPWSRSRSPRPSRPRGGGFRTVERELNEVAEEVVQTTRSAVDTRSKAGCLARFRNLRALGAGEYGYTYRFDGQDGARYALKTVFFTPLSRPAKYNNLVNEIRIARAMGKIGVGPRVYNVYQCEEDGGMLVMIVMELMKWGDIEQFSRFRAVTDGHMREIERLLQRMHEAGYAHNDIHSGNIMVTEKAGRVTFRLGDFGLSKKADAESMRSDREGLRHLVSYVNRDHLRALLYDLVRRGEVAVDIDIRYSASAQSPDFSYLLKHAALSARPAALRGLPRPATGQGQGSAAAAAGPGAALADRSGSGSGSGDGDGDSDGGRRGDRRVGTAADGGRRANAIRTLMPPPQKPRGRPPSPPAPAPDRRRLRRQRRGPS